MGTPWKTVVARIRDGQQVRAANANAGPDDLETRTNHLYERVEAATAANAIIRYDVPMASGLSAGNIVYWDDDNGRYDLALAAIDIVDGVWTLDQRAFAIGIVTQKTASSRGDILISGCLAGASAAVLAGLIDVSEDSSSSSSSGAGSYTEGPYWLSNADAGKAVSHEVSYSTYIGYLVRQEGSWIFYFNPVWRNIYEGHIHFRFRLHGKPAGTANYPERDYPHYITAADAAQTGWLPADHSSIAEYAPEGAVFGYNMSTHSAVSNAWPPMPLSSAILTYNGHEVPSNLYQVNNYGIWWMTRCFGLVPWSIYYGTPPSSPSEEISSSSSSLSSSSSSEAGPPACYGPFLEWLEGHLPPGIAPEEIELQLTFTRLPIKSAAGVVESLHSSDTVLVKDLQGDEATSGDLTPELNWNRIAPAGGQGTSSSSSSSLGEEELSEAHVLRAHPMHEDNRMLAQTAVTRVKAGSSQVVITPDSEHGFGNATNGYYGVLYLGFQSETVLRVDVSVVALDGIRKDVHEVTHASEPDIGIHYLTFPSDRRSALTGKIIIPATVPAGQYLYLKTWIFCPDAAIPASGGPLLTASYLSMSKPGAGNELDLPSSITAWAWTRGVTTAANKYVEGYTSALSVTAGDIVMFTLERDGLTDSFAYDVGLPVLMGEIASTFPG